MNLDTGVLIAKATCYFIIGFGTPLSAGLVPWVNSHELPDTVTWVALFIAASVGGATSMLAFFSGAYSDYKKNNPKPLTPGGSHPGNPE